LLESSIELSNLNTQVEENWASDSNSSSSPNSDTTVKPSSESSTRIADFNYTKLFK
jgi:hypothetical protein